jgi:hypothetical protein
MANVAAEVVVKLAHAHFVLKISLWRHRAKYKHHKMAGPAIPCSPGQKAKTIHGVCDYLYRNRERMRYDEYLRNCWQSRQAPSSHLSGNLTDYWQHHIKLDQQRLYRKDSWQPVLK